jgi:putative membrane protein
MLSSRLDSVSNIHRRWSFTRLNPQSYKISYILSMFAATNIIIISDIFYFKIDQINLSIYLPLGLMAITGAKFLDFLALRGTPINKITKVFHVSAFANILWALTILLGIALHAVLSKSAVASSNYIIEGMFLAIGLRIGIFTSVFGAGIGRAIAVSFIQPSLFLFSFVPFTFYNRVLTDSMGLGYGFALVILGILWTIAADRAGRPIVKSTFGILQAFIAAWTENKTDKMEEIAESKAHNKLIRTRIVKFNLANSKEIAIILPDVHPGPFNPIGGSNLPYTLYNLFSKKALVMHSISDHSLNIPSKMEVERYIKTLSKARTYQKDNICTIPVQVKFGKCTVTGIAFSNTAIIILSMAPTGMEDVPKNIRTELEKYSLQLGFFDVLVVDSHNAMGKPLISPDDDDLLSTAKQCLKRLKYAPQYEFKIGFANSDDVSCNTSLMEDLGKSGLATILIEVKGNQYFIGWADSNNMVNSLRDYVISRLNDCKIQMLEICTSDTHSTSGKRTRQGYYPFGDLSKPQEVAKIYHQISKKTIENVCISKFELLYAESRIKVMGKNQFDDYSLILDKSLRVTKLFLGITILTYIVMLITNLI